MAAQHPAAPSAPHRGRRRWWIWGLAGAGVLVLVAVLWLMSRGSGASTSSPVVGPVDAGAGGSGLDSGNTGAGPSSGGPVTTGPAPLQSTAPCPPGFVWAGPPGGSHMEILSGCVPVGGSATAGIPQATMLNTPEVGLAPPLAPPSSSGFAPAAQVRK